MSKPNKPLKMRILEIDEQHGLLTDETKAELESLRYDYEAAQYDEADKVNDVKYEGRSDNE